MNIQTTKYELLEIPSKGGFGVVCIAKDTADEVFAIKVLSLDRASQKGLLERARDEARMLSRLNHDNLVRVQPTLEVNGRQAVVMEYVRGANADELLRDQTTLPIPVAIAMVRDAALGLEAAWSSVTGSDNHPMRVIHRDLKPDNVMLSVDGVVKVVDFGMAKASFGDRETQSTAFVPGSRGYISPERYDGLDTPKGDVYALGLTLVQLLSGHKPVVSLRFDKHDEDVKRAIEHADLQAAGAAQADLRALLRLMCAYSQDERPWMNDAAEQLSALLAQLGGADLPAFATKVVVPIYAGRTRMSPQEHPRYPEVRFLEGDGVTRGPLDLSAEVRRLASSPELPGRARELAAMLAAHPQTDVRPLLILLDNAASPGWAFWRKAPPIERVVAALTALAPIKDRGVLDRCRRLVKHPDPSVARRAKALLEASVA
ncbi:MAG: serine/threonine-protein kinase [Myxococcota bacterium]